MTALHRDLVRRTSAPPALAAHLLLAADEVRAGEARAGAVTLLEGKADGMAGFCARLRMRALPLPGEAFTGAISPLASPAERAGLIDLIASHGGQVSVQVSALPGARVGIVQALHALHRATARASEMHRPAGLLWAPTGRLLRGLALQPLLNMRDPLALFLAPVLGSGGPARQPVLRLAGARARLGFSLSVALSQLDAKAAHVAALAFARTCLADPSVLTGGRFHHEGRQFDIALDMKARAVRLVPLAKPLQCGAGTVSRPAISSGEKALSATT